MKHKDLYNLLKKLNIPVAYDHFDDNKNLKPPFMAYREQAADTFNADNKNYFLNKKFEIELVTLKKDVELEERVEELLNNNNISFDKSDEIWDKDEKIYHIFYEI